MDAFASLSPAARNTILARARGRCVFLPEGGEERILAAASSLRGDYGVKVRLGSAESAHAARAETLSVMSATAAGKGRMPPASDDPRLLDSFYEGGAALSRGEVDACVGGCSVPTAEVIRAALATVGLDEKAGVLTSAFLFALREPTPGGEELLLYADCAVIPQPTVKQLPSIAWLASEAFRKWTAQDSRVAFLSFSTAGSAAHPDCIKMRQACQAFQSAHPEVNADGEIQFDAATVPEVALRKDPASHLRGRANVFIFPDLDAGNISYKITQRLAGASAWGPVLLGTKAPFSDLSRGASAADIVQSALLTLALAGE